MKKSELRALQREWYQRLHDEGFRDIERPDGSLKSDPIAHHPILQAKPKCEGETENQYQNRVEGIQTTWETTSAWYDLLRDALTHGAEIGLTRNEARALYLASQGANASEVGRVLGINRKGVKQAIIGIAERASRHLEKIDVTLRGRERDVEMLAHYVSSVANRYRHPVFTKRMSRPSDLLSEQVDAARNERQLCERKRQQERIKAALTQIRSRSMRCKQS